MLELLKWGMKAFPFKEVYEGAHFWITMSMLDGPNGYNLL